MKSRYDIAVEELQEKLDARNVMNKLLEKDKYIGLNEWQSLLSPKEKLILLFSSIELGYKSFQTLSRSNFENFFIPYYDEIIDTIASICEPNGAIYHMMVLLMDIKEEFDMYKDFNDLPYDGQQRVKADFIYTMRLRYLPLRQQFFEDLEKEIDNL